MKGSLRRALALLVAIMMVSTCMPLTALAEIIEASGSVQPFRVIQPDQGVYVTFEFYNGDEKVDTQIVTNGDTLYAPASPEKEGYKFTGWMKEGGEAFGGFGVVEGYAESQTIRLDAGFEQVYYVFFLDQNGTVCVTKEGLSGASISTTDVTFPTATDEGIAGWYYDADKKVPAGSAVTLEDANIILYPDVQQGHWLTFDTAGGSYLDPVFVAPGAVTQTPDTPTRLGFDFLGWYNGEQPFSFGQELTASVELTAKWQGHQVDYKVLYWLENADDDGYSLDKMDTLHGIAGEMTEAGSNYNPGEGFHLSADHSLVQQTIAGDGSTLVNVYYDRDVYTIYFYQRNASTTSMICGKEEHTHHKGWNSCYDRWGNLTCGKEEHTHTAACYAPNPSAYAADPIVAKYGAYIGDQWPSNNESGNNWSTQNNGSDPYQANIQTMPLGGTTFYVPNNGGDRRFSATYYAEVLDGEQGTVSHDGRMYNVHHTDVIYADNSSLYVSEEDRYPLVGFTFVDGTALHANYNRAVFYYTRNDYTLTRINQGTTDAHTVQYEADISGYGAVPERPAGIPENYAFQGWYLDEEFQEAYDFSGKVMPAQNVTVYAKWAAPEVDATVYLTMAGDGEPRVQAIPYGTKIDEEWLESLQVTAPEGYTWHGWATKNGDVYTPFNLDTIITQDVTLYPYYTSNASFTVAYDANGGEGTVADAKKYADRAYADVQSYAGLTAPQGKVFLGWNTAADGSGEMYQPGDKLLVAAENANEGNVVTLYAQWGGQAGTVELTYHANFTEAATATKEETQLINNGVITVSSYEATGLSERAGYEFIGWNTAADGTGTAFAAGQNVRVNDKSAAEANHLYAQWEKKVATYTVQHYIQVLDAEDKLQYELADEESFTVDVGTSVNDELINALKKSDLTDTDVGIGSPAYADGLYHYVYERNKAELAVDGQITSDADVIKLYYQRELRRTTFDDGVVSAEDAYRDDPNEIRQGVITVETHYVGGSKDGTGKTDKVYFMFNKSEMVDLKIAVNSNEYILNTITADLSGGNRWNGTVLDNVLGNSTVRIYLTPKYTLEYYKVENGEETRVYADVETETYTLAPETTGTQAFVQTEYPTSATLQPLPEEEGYTWSGWYQDAGLTGDTLPENSVQKINDLVEDTTEKVIKLYTGNKTANEYPYTIHHYLYGTTVKVAEDTTGTDAFGTNVMVIPATKFLAGFEKAQAKNSIPAMITIKVDGNEATVYYTVPLTLTADGASKTYDGDPLTCGTFTADGLVNGDEVTDFALSMTAESTITNVGTQPNVIDEATVTYKDGAIPSYYTVAYEPGALTINASAEEVVVTITEHSATETYDGTEKSVTGYTVTDISNELYTEDDFTFNGTAEAKGTEVGFYPMNLTEADFTNRNKNFSNVKFVIVDGGLTIEKRPVTVTVNTETYKYDGYLKTVADDNGQEYTVEGESEGRGLLNGDDISLNVVYGVYADEAQSLVGQYTADAKDGSIVISNANGDVTKNYAVTVVPGWLVITDGTEDDPVNPDAVLTKTHPAGVYDLGDVTFTITVKNIYNEAKTITIREQPGVELIDADAEGKLVYQDVPAGEQVTAYAKYTITEADILEGTFTNHVTAEFSDAKTYTNEDTVDIADLDTTLTVVKSSGVPEGGTASLGETINYTITVTNDGNVSYTGVKVVDDLAGLQIHEDARYTVEEDGTVTVGDLAVGETVTITASYIVTSDDIKAGHVLNAVTAAGDPIEDPKNPDEPKKPEGEDEEDDETDDLDTTLTVVKTSDVAEGATVGLGETINYTITVKNDGNVPYTGVNVVDDLAGLQIHEDARYTVEEDGTVTVGDLAVGETVTITASYVVTSDDIKAGHVLNAITAAGDPIEDPKNPDEPKKPEGEDEEDDETDDLDTTLTVVKTSDVAEGEVAKEGQTIHYTITVTNEGNVPYTDVTVIDDMEGLVIDANDRYTVQEDGTVTVGGLAVGETVTITASYTVTADDILVGTVVNAATVSGDDVEDPKNPDEPKTPEGGDETEVTLAVDVPVTVHWVDGDQFYRPTAALTVQLIGNDGVVMDEVVVDPTTMGTDWTYTFENMPTHDENGDLIVYSVLEPVAPGNGRYDVTYNGLEVTNTAYVTVTFVDWNGAVLQNERILVGATGTVPESPRRVGYNFTQWSGGSWENVTRDQIIHANYMTVYEAIDELNIPLAGGTIQNVGDCFD